MTFRALSTPLTCLLTLSLAVACGPEDDDGGSGDGNGDGDTTTGDGDGDGGGSTGSDGDGGETGGGGGDDGEGDSGGTEDTGGGGFLDEPDMGPPPPQPNGSECTSNEECESEKCYQVGALGGFCSECLSDEECMEDGGAGTCSFDAAMQYAVCTDGELGVMCDSDDGCSGELVCATLFDTGGAFPADFCSECKADGDCSDGNLCSPAYSLDDFSGHLACVEPESVANGQGCDHEGTGDQACESGHCTTADLGGALTLGVCGECSTDEDCADGETCMAATADTSGLTGSTCG